MDRRHLLTLMPWLFMICFAPVWATRSIAQTGVAVQKVQIADGIYQFITAPDGYVPNGNSVVIVNENDVLVFDTFTRPSTARTVLAEIRKITDKPVRYVVNSHHHPDHWSGNEVYAEAFPGLEIIAYRGNAAIHAEHRECMAGGVHGKSPQGPGRSRQRGEHRQGSRTERR